MSNVNLPFQPGDIVSLQADNSLYLSRYTEGTRQMVEAAKTFIDRYSRFEVTVLANGKIALKADNGLYLTRYTEGSRQMIEAAKGGIDPYCEFAVTVLGGGKIALQADNGLYLTRYTEGSKQMIEASKSTIDPFSQFSVTVNSPLIEHVFVLMLENRSFDHMLGFSGIKGFDAVTRQKTDLAGLIGNDIEYYNAYRGSNYPVTRPADAAMPCDPGHEFTDVVTQLCGQGHNYPPGGPYPTPLDNSGFAANYADHSGHCGGDISEIMKCQNANQVLVLTTLAKEFAVCDQWFSSLPGPTWPNRFFLHAASSNGLDHSPSTSEIVDWLIGYDYFTFPNGTIFDRFTQNGLTYRIYSGDSFPVVGALQINNHHGYSRFAKDLAKPDYDAQYTFIEPDYGHVVTGHYKKGTSQHPLDGVFGGETLILETYEAIRNSVYWPTSVLIVTWDEHGGFYDHVPPPAAVNPGDDIPASYNDNRFTFTQYGVRVPAVVISPYIAAHTIDHRVYDHTSVLATLEALFGLAPLTGRDAQANNLVSLFTLVAPRTDTPVHLPAPQSDTSSRPAGGPADVQDGILLSSLGGNGPGFLHVAAVRDIALSPASEHASIRARLKGLKTVGDARQYMSDVRNKILAAQGEAVAVPAHA